MWSTEYLSIETKSDFIGNIRGKRRLRKIVALVGDNRTIVCHMLGFSTLSLDDSSRTQYPNMGWKRLGKPNYAVYPQFIDRKQHSTFEKSKFPTLFQNRSAKSYVCMLHATNQQRNKKTRCCTSGGLYFRQPQIGVAVLSMVSIISKLSPIVSRATC